MSRGIDTAVNLTLFAGLLKREYDFVIRYYNAINPRKNLSRTEAAALCAAGLRIAAVWEDGSPTNAAYFGHKKGLSDGKAAFNYAKGTIGQPLNAPIYFAVDYDASAQDLEGLIIPYFQGISEAFHTAAGAGLAYPIGVYGSGLTCRTLLAAGLVSFT
jgi:hypothetical protein